MTERRADLDLIDRKILNELQRNCRQPFAQLAEIAGTSAPSCQRRVRRLRAAGYIEREVALLDPAVAGTTLIAISEIRLDGHDRKRRDQTIRQIREIPEVIVCYNVTGERDLMFISVLCDMADFEAKITEPLSANPAIQSISSYFAIKSVKFAPFIRFSEQP